MTSYHNHDRQGDEPAVINIPDKPDQSTPRTPAEAVNSATDLMVSLDDNFKSIFGASIEKAAGDAQPLLQADLNRSFCFGAPPPES